MVDRDFLLAHAEHRNEYEDELRRYELINGVSFYRSPSNNDGMPHAAGGISDPTASNLINKLDSGWLIEKLEKLIKEEEQQIEAILNQIPKATYKTVIRIRYYQRYEWDDVALFMYGDRRDYARDTEKYKTKAQKIHGAALAYMKRVQLEQMQN